MSLAHYEYTTRSGDSLGRIIYGMYGWTPTGQPATYGATLKGVLAMNPHLTDPDRIAAGTVLRLPADPTSASLRAVRPSVLLQQGFASDSLTAAERERVTTLAWLAHNSNWLTVPGGDSERSGNLTPECRQPAALAGHRRPVCGFQAGAHHPHRLQRPACCQTRPVPEQYRSLGAVVVSEEGGDRGDAARDQFAASGNFARRSCAVEAAFRSCVQRRSCLDRDWSNCGLYSDCAHSKYQGKERNIRGDSGKH